MAGIPGNLIKVSYRTVKLIWALYPFTLIGLVILVILRGIYPPLEISLFRRLIDLLSNNQYSLPLVYQLVAVLFVGRILGYFELNLRQTSEIKVKHTLSERFMDLSMGTPLVHLENTLYYDQLHRAKQVIDGDVIHTLLYNIFEVFQSLISLVIYVGMLSILGWPILLLFTLTVIPKVWVHVRKNRMEYGYYLQTTQAERRAWYLLDILYNFEFAKDVQVYGLLDYFRNQWKKQFKRLRVVYLRHQRDFNFMGGLAEMISQVMLGLIFLIVARNVYSDNLPVGDYAILFMMVNRLSGELSRIVFSLSQMQRSVFTVEQFFKFHDNSIQMADDEGKGILPFPIMSKGITFKDINFKYPGSSKLVLRNASFTFNVGETVAIVGENGAGKSTLVKIMLGLLPVEKGDVFIDDIPLKEIDKIHLYQNVSVVFQDFIKYELSLRENIGFGSLHLLNDDTAILSAAEKGNALPFIVDNNLGLDTELGKLFGLYEPSEGQWQAIAASRGFMKESQILVLDEPTASLDPLRETQILKQYLEESRHKTTIIVTHRLGSARIADKILVMHNGEIVEFGTHDNLIKNRGYYWVLWNKQSKWYSEGEVDDSG